MAQTLAAHRSGLLAYYDAMITSGPMEGTNNKIKTMKRQAYGFRDKEFFKLKILGIHETRYNWSDNAAWACCWAARARSG
jgi:transposase